MSLNPELRGMLALVNFPWTVVKFMLPGTVIFVNTHGRILARAELCTDFMIPSKTARVIMAPMTFSTLNEKGIAP